MGDVGGEAIRDGPLPTHVSVQVGRPRDLEPVSLFNLVWQGGSWAEGGVRT